jgi:mono/diheme cytochrome c family protein
MGRIAATLAAAGLVIGAALWWASAPAAPRAEISGVKGDAARGQAVVFAAGCASCHHSAPQGSARRNPDLLGGGMAFVTEFGTFRAPNISPGPAGVGGWTLAQFDRALRQGVSPEGRHYYPVFPYTAYARMTDGDVADLWAYLQTLPPQPDANLAHDLKLPFSIRRGVGLWKRAFASDAWVLAEAPSPQLSRGRYLVEALAHCGECHTPRNAAGALDTARWLAGAPNPTGRGTIPALTPDRLTWSAEDIAYYLETGFTPGFDSAGGSMVAVVENLARLPATDRAAVAAYLKALPAR